MLTSPLKTIATIINIEAYNVQKLHVCIIDIKHENLNMERHL